MGKLNLETVQPIDFGICASARNTLKGIDILKKGTKNALSLMAATTLCYFDGVRPILNKLKTAIFGLFQDKKDDVCLTEFFFMQKRREK